MNSFLTIALLFTATPSFAYIPPSQFIVKNIVNKRSDVKSIRIRTMVTELEGDKPTAHRFTEITTYHAQSGTLKSWALGENGVRLYGVQRRAMTVTPISSLLLEPRLAEVVRSLRDSGIPIRTEDELKPMKDEDERRGAEVSYLARWRGTVAWVIGRKTPPDSHDFQPQLWVEKDTFYPLRMRYTTGKDEGVDVHFENVKTFRGIPMPKTLTVYGKEGNALLRDDLLEVAVNPKAEDIEEAVDGGFTEASSSISSSLKDLIQRYYGTVR